MTIFTSFNEKRSEFYDISSRLRPVNLTGFKNHPENLFTFLFHVETQTFCFTAAAN